MCGLPPAGQLGCTGLLMWPKNRARPPHALHSPNLCLRSCAPHPCVQLAERNQGLQADRSNMVDQLERFAAAVQRAEGDHGALQAAAEALRAAEALQAARAQEAEAEVQRLAALVDSAQSAKAALERQLAAARAEAVQAGGERQELVATVAALQSERDALAGAVEQLRQDRAELETAVGRLRDQLHQSNSVLDGCRAMLADCCAARCVARGGAPRHASTGPGQAAGLFSPELLKQGVASSRAARVPSHMPAGPPPPTSR